MDLIRLDTAVADARRAYEAAIMALRVRPGCVVGERGWPLASDHAGPGLGQ